MNQISLCDITKKYNGRTILEGVRLSIEPGDAIAFVGSNGCGKTTMLKIIAGLVKPTSGMVRYEKRLLFHYVPEKFMPLPMCVMEYLMAMGGMDGMRKQEAQLRTIRLAKDFAMEEMLMLPMKTLSKGTLQKIGVIQALLVRPQVLLLDEPISGQDTASCQVMIAKINQMRSEGVTVLLSCHEPFLTHALTRKQFTVKDGKIVPYVADTEPSYLVIIERGTDSMELPSAITEELRLYGSGFCFHVRESDVNRVVACLLEKKWKLKGLYQDENKSVSIIPSEVMG